VYVLDLPGEWECAMSLIERPRYRSTLIQPHIQASEYPERKRRRKRRPTDSFDGIDKQP
jgi:hypothetical protein